MLRRPILAFAVACGLSSAATMADERTGIAAEKAGDFREAFLEYMGALRTLRDPPPNDDDVRIRERILGVVHRLGVAPRVPEEVEARLTSGVRAFAEAKDREGFLTAAAEFRRAVVLAPWHAPALLNLALVQEALGQFGPAAANLRFHAMVVEDAQRGLQSRTRSSELEDKAVKLRAAIDDYLHSGRVPSDEVLAANLYAQTCDANNGRGCLDLSNAYYYGRGVPKDLARAASLGLRACDAGQSDGCARAGVAEDERPTADAVQVADLFERACRDGSAWGCINLGIRFEYGLGRVKDARRALEGYDQACRGGALRACALAGRLLGEGLGVSKDPVRAVAYWRPGCEGKNSLSCFYLGSLYRAGAKGVKVDRPAAASAFEDACAFGDAGGCDAAGVMWENGEGVLTDPVRAADFYEKGCKAGGAAACVNLGICYRDGRGKPMDIAKAAVTFKLACDGGHSKACGLLEGLKRLRQ